jgi:lipopolysaccharide assembly protein A
METHVMRIVLVLLLLLAAVIFAAQNATVVTITVLAWRLDASLAIVVAIALAVGAIGGLLAGVPRLYRMRAHEKRLRAQLADLGGDDPTLGEPTVAPAESFIPSTRKTI